MTAGFGSPEFLRCALDPRNKLCQMKASLRRSSISFTVQLRVGRDWRNIIISCFWHRLVLSCDCPQCRKFLGGRGWKEKIYIPESPSSRAVRTISLERRRRRTDGSLRNLALPPEVGFVVSLGSLILLRGMNTYHISIPHPNGILYAYLSHQETVHPTETELDELHPFVLEMFC